VLCESAPQNNEFLAIAFIARGSPVMDQRCRMFSVLSFIDRKRGEQTDRNGGVVSGSENLLQILHAER
jgi:hypothetical protein